MNLDIRLSLEDTAFTRNNGYAGMPIFTDEMLYTENYRLLCENSNLITHLLYNTRPFLGRQITKKRFEEIVTYCPHFLHIKYKDEQFLVRKGFIGVMNNNCITDVLFCAVVDNRYPDDTERIEYFIKRNLSKDIQAIIDTFVKTYSVNVHYMKDVFRKLFYNIPYPEYKTLAEKKEKEDTITYNLLKEYHEEMNLQKKTSIEDF